MNSFKVDRRGFTIVELLIVIVIIAILAAITIIAYNGITQRARVAALQSDLSNAYTSLGTYQVTNGTYPDNLADANLKSSQGNTFTYNPGSGNSSYCLQAAGFGVTYVVTDTNNTPAQGYCSGSTAVLGGGSAPVTPPAVASIGYANTSTTGSSTTQIAVPSGVTTGSLVVVMIYGCWGGSSDAHNGADALGMSGGPYTAPSGFTFETGYEWGYNDAWVGVYYKYATASDTGTYNFVSKTIDGNTTGGVNWYQGGFAALITGGPTSGDPFVDGWHYSTSGPISSFTPGGNNSLLLAGNFDESAGTSTWPTGWSQLSGSSSNLLLAGDTTQTTATATGSLAFGRSASDVTGSSVVVIRP